MISTRNDDKDIKYTGTKQECIIREETMPSRPWGSLGLRLRDTPRAWRALFPCKFHAVLILKIQLPLSMYRWQHLHTLFYMLYYCNEPIGLKSALPGKIPKLIPRTEIGDRKANNGINTIPYSQTHPRKSGVESNYQ